MKRRCSSVCRSRQQEARKGPLAGGSRIDPVLVGLEQQIGQHATRPPAPDTNPAETLCMLQADLHTARAAVRDARQALKPIPANTINPDATRATPRVNRRALQTVCRLLAYNAELDLDPRHQHLEPDRGRRTAGAAMRSVRCSARGERAQRPPKLPRSPSGSSRPGHGIAFERPLATFRLGSDHARPSIAKCTPRSAGRAVTPASGGAGVSATGHGTRPMIGCAWGSDAIAAAPP